MSAIAVRARLLRWGNSYGVRLSRKDIERLRLRPGAEITLRIDLPTPAQTPSLPAFHLGGTAADDHDALFAASTREDED